MGNRKVIVKQSAAENIAAISWFIESKGLIATADKFADAVYDFFLTLSDTRKSHTLCKEPERAALGFKCITFKKKYTVVLLNLQQK
ncbi:MAG: hypothetical protein JST87_10270 [Bacteroidetes bacterium]|nr:hypothetical protein [Bacteroidota bacterium]